MLTIPTAPYSVELKFQKQEWSGPRHAQTQEKKNRNRTLNRVRDLLSITFRVGRNMKQAEVDILIRSGGWAAAW